MICPSLTAASRRKPEPRIVRRNAVIRRIRGRNIRTPCISLSKPQPREPTTIKRARHARVSTQRRIEIVERRLEVAAPQMHETASLLRVRVIGLSAKRRITICEGLLQLRTQHAMRSAACGEKPPVRRLKRNRAIIVCRGRRDIAHSER